VTVNVSGLLVVVHTDHFDAGLDAIRALPGLEVHQTDPATGRAVVTQEAESVGAEVEGLKRIKALPQVRYAELVYHRFDEDPQLLSAVPGELDAFEGVDPARRHLDKA
jgi:nitrate reductase NapD